MADIEILIHDLHSSDLERRYQACKGLREQEHLPPKAVNALQEASTDPEPLISVTASRALLRHEPRSDESYLFKDLPEDVQRPYTPQELFNCLALSAVVVLLTIPLISILLDDRLNDLWFISLPVIFIAGYISYINFEDHQPRRFIAILSSIAVGLLVGTISFVLLSILFLSAVSAYRGY